MLRQKPHLPDPAVLFLFEPADLGLPHHAGPVFKCGLQAHILVCNGEHPSGDGQHLAHPRHRLIKGGGNAVERRQDQIPKGLPSQAPGVFGKAVGQQLAHHGLHIGQRLHTVTDVPRRGHPQVLPEHSGAPPVIRHGHDGGQVAGILFETAQHGGQSGPPADGGDLRSVLPTAVRAAIWFDHKSALLSPASCLCGSPRRCSPSAG